MGDHRVRRSECEGRPGLHVEDVDPEQPGASRYRSHAEAAATTAEDLAPGHVVVSAAVILGCAVARD